MGYFNAVIQFVPVNGKATGFNVPVVALGGGGVGKPAEPGDGVEGDGD